LDNLDSALSSARQAQLERVSALTKRTGELFTLRQRYEQSAETSWHSVREQKAQLGDPSELPSLLSSVRERLAPACQKLSLTQPGNTLADLENNLASARRSQPTAIGRLEQQIATLNSMQQRYHQAAVTNWQGISELRAQWGDPGVLSSLVAKIQDDLNPILRSLGLPMPQPVLPSLDASLADARRMLPGAVGRLERRSGDLLVLKDRYLQASLEVVEDLAVPPDLIARRRDLQNCTDATIREGNELKRQLSDMRAREGQADALRIEVQALPEAVTQIERLQGQLKHLESAGKRGTLYNQALDVGRQYLEQAKPDSCPVCKQAIGDLDSLLGVLRSETPADVEKIRQDYSALREQLRLKQVLVSDLENRRKQLAGLEMEIARFPSGLELQITQRQLDGVQAADELAKVQANIVRIEGRIQRIAETRGRLQAVVKETKTALGDAHEADPPAALERAASAARQQAVRLGSLDLQPVADLLSRVRQLYEIEREEERLRQQLRLVLTETTNALGPVPAEDIATEFERAVQRLRAQTREIQDLDFQPIADDLARARQLRQIQEEEERLGKELTAVETQIQAVLNVPFRGIDLRAALEGTIREVQARGQQVNDLDLQPVATGLQHASRLNEIRLDESELRRLESSYQTANREKARLNYQIRQLTALREALLDIAETTKQHQETIIMDVLSNLNIHRYYQQLDPHPAYTDLQIEPELTSKGTYNYWIKALTSDYSHGTYVQTRFSTAQANCAAIAIFLAVNEHLSKALETVVLDDPSQSMDPDHMRRLAETLATSPRQVIVATEDSQMYGFLRTAFEAPTIYELSSWTTDGARLL
jgi:hypothetical protein